MQSQRAAPATAEARARWDESVARLREGMRLWLTNDVAAAEALFEREMARPPMACAPASGWFGSLSISGMVASLTSDADADADADTDADTEGLLEARDTRGAFALVYAVVGLFRGVMSLANDQLHECLGRLREAERLAALDTPWVGRKVVRGVGVLLTGLVQVLQHEVIRGVYSVLRSWRWIRCLRTEALHYSGVGAEVIRSSALITLGAFALVVSLLPRHLIAAATWTTGFEIDRDAGVAMLRSCVSEGGLFAPLAAFGLLKFELDVRTFLGEARADGALEECAEILQWADKEFGGSAFFTAQRADYHACRRLPPFKPSPRHRHHHRPALITRAPDVW